MIEHFELKSSIILNILNFGGNKELTFSYLKELIFGNYEKIKNTRFFQTKIFLQYAILLIEKSINNNNEEEISNFLRKFESLFNDEDINQLLFLCKQYNLSQPITFLYEKKGILLLL
jgi:hypothetical protein